MEEVQHRQPDRPLHGDGSSIRRDWILKLPRMPDKSDRKACCTAGAGAETTYSMTGLPAFCQLMSALSSLSCKLTAGDALKFCTLCNTIYLSLLSSDVASGGVKVTVCKILTVSAEFVDSWLNEAATNKDIVPGQPTVWVNVLIFYCLLLTAGAGTVQTQLSHASFHS